MVEDLTNTKPDVDEPALPAPRLRPATSSDEPFLLLLFGFTRAEFALINWDEQQKEALIAMQFTAQNRQYVESYPRAQNSIIMWGDAPIGRLLVDRGEREFTLVDISLLPAHRGAGIGSHLIRDLLLEAKAAGKPTTLNVWYSNPAKKLYERLGFSTVKDDGVYCEMRWSSGL